jgi:hypothetical protein
MFSAASSTSTAALPETHFIGPAADDVDHLRATAPYYVGLSRSSISVRRQSSPHGVIYANTGLHPWRRREQPVIWTLQVVGAKRTPQKFNDAA